MRFKDIFFTDIEPEIRDEFQLQILIDNIKRIKIFAYVIITFETMMAASDLVTSMLRVDMRFAFNNYLIAYLIMIFITVMFLVYIKKIDDVKCRPVKVRKKIDNIIMAYITFLLCWGSLITLMDQKLYGQLIAFMINMIVCSTLYYFECRKLLFPYVASSAILFIGLPLFQQSKDVLIGHYINLTVFLVISFICSRILFHNYCHDFNNRTLIERMHLDMRQLSYLDELTNIPNRRSLNFFIESRYLSNSKPGFTISVIMIDIDLFKQFNDRYGHVEGDRVLVEVAEQISLSAADTNDFAARIGGEEFIYVAENQSLFQTKKIAEEIRSRVIDLQVPHESSSHGILTISLGISRIALVSENDIFKCIEYSSFMP